MTALRFIMGYWDTIASEAVLLFNLLFTDPISTRMVVKLVR